MDTLSSSEVIKKKPGPQAKPKIDVAELEARIHNLEELLIRIGHQMGLAHAIIKKAGLEPYQPTKGDMAKFKVV